MLRSGGSGDLLRVRIQGGATLGQGLECATTSSGKRLFVLCDDGECWEPDLAIQSQANGIVQVVCVRGEGRQPRTMAAPKWDIEYVYVLHVDGRVKGVPPAHRLEAGKAFWSRDGSVLRVGSLHLVDPGAAIWFLSADGHAACGSIADLLAGAELEMLPVTTCSVPATETGRAGSVEWSVKLPGQSVDVWLKLGDTELAGQPVDQPLTKVLPRGCRGRFLLRAAGESRVVREW